MSEKLPTDALWTFLADGSFSGLLLAGLLIFVVVLLVWFPPPLFSFLRGLVEPGLRGAVDSLAGAAASRER